MTRAGILHRDVSVNNILIVDDPEDQASFVGFIHDFDYSWMSRKPPPQDLASSPSTMFTKLLNDDDREGELQQRRVYLRISAGSYTVLTLPNNSGNHLLHGRHALGGIR